MYWHKKSNKIKVFLKSENYHILMVSLPPVDQPDSLSGRRVKNTAV